MGYYRAGFTEIVGIDNRPMPRYPFEFVLGDALEYVAAHGHEFDCIHASPPCQKYSITRNLKTTRDDYPDLVALTRERLKSIGIPFVIENVPGAPLENPLMLCGTMFGLGVFRHRLFETNPAIWFAPMSCSHNGRAMPMWWASRKKFLAQGREYKYMTVAGNSFLISEARRAMGIDWMTRAEIAQAIPPAYTEYIGRYLIAACRERA